jgi:hypothetical protein
MEMIATNTLWCLVVRMRGNRDARVYRVFRHPLVERRIVELLKYAAARARTIESVVQEPPFVEMRACFDEIARRMPFAQITLSAEHAERYKAHRAQVAAPRALSLRQQLLAQIAFIVDEATPPEQLQGLCAAHSETLRAFVAGSSCSSSSSSSLGTRRK